jgi:GNAT superfamily N-acetyltransferase
MYYEVDLTKYKNKNTKNHLVFNSFNFSPFQLKAIEYELDNFKDSFGKSWKEFDIKELEYRMKNNWTMFLFGSGRTGEIVLEGWSFIDWNYKYPYLKNRYVCPDFRGQGLGTELMNCRFNYLKDNNHNIFYGFVEDWNKPAIPILQQEGIWKEIKKSDIYR